MKDELNFYLHEVDIYLLNLEKRLIKELSEKENVAEKLKNGNQILWVRCMNNIKNLVEEIILREYIYNNSI